MGELRRRLYDIHFEALASSNRDTDFYQWRGQAVAYMQILEYLGTAEGDAIRGPFVPEELDEER